MFAIRVPVENEREPDHVEHVLDALHARMRRGDCVTLSLARHAGQGGLFIDCPAHLESVVCGSLQAFYPDAEIESLGGSLLDAGEGNCMSASLRLRPDVFPIRRYAEMSASESGILVDPLSGVLGSLSLSDRARVDLVLRRASRRRQARAQRLVEVLHRPLFRSRPRLARRFALLPRRLALLAAWLIPTGALDSTHRELMTTPDREHKREGDIEAANDKLTAHPLFEAELRFVVMDAGDNNDKAEQTLLSMMAAYAPFVRRRQVEWRASPGRGRRFLLSTEEAASLWHPPATETAITSLQQTAPATRSALSAGRRDAVLMRRLIRKMLKWAHGSLSPERSSLGVERLTPTPRRFLIQYWRTIPLHSPYPHAHHVATGTMPLRRHSPPPTNPNFVAIMASF